VRDNLRIGGHTMRRDRARIARSFDEALETFPELASRLDQPAGTLSGGEQQMLALSRVMMTAPQLLMIDELSLGLAPMTVERLMGMVRRINESGATVILVEQSLNRALSLADRCFFMERGEIRFDGPTTELMERHDLLRPVFLGTASTGLG
jgi:branched-chain amino acid transport system ATP-binding protein